MEKITKKFASRRPAGSRIGSMDEFICKHRDLSCCPTCANEYPNIIDVVGVHYWFKDEAEVALFEEMVAEGMVN